MGAVDRGAQIVGDDELRAALEEGEGADVRRRPVRQGLRPGRLGERVARRAEHGDEDLRLTQFAGLRVDDRHGLAGIVDEHPLAGAMLLAHHDVELARPGAVLLAEAAVLQPLRMGRLVLLPQQRERHALAPQLLVDVAPGRKRTRRAARRRRREQPSLQRRVVDGLRDRPAQAGDLGATHVVFDRRRRHAQAAGDRAAAQRGGEAQPQDVSNLAHGQPPVRQRPPPRKARRVARLAGCPAPLSSDDRRSIPTGVGDRFPSESVIDLDRSQ